jgi:hypothetical protein
VALLRLLDPKPRSTQGFRVVLPESLLFGDEFYEREHDSFGDRTRLRARHRPRSRRRRTQTPTSAVLELDQWICVGIYLRHNRLELRYDTEDPNSVATLIADDTRWIEPSRELAKPARR